MRFEEEFENLVDIGLRFREIIGSRWWFNLRGLFNRIKEIFAELDEEDRTVVGCREEC